MKYCTTLKKKRFSRYTFVGENLQDMLLTKKKRVQYRKKAKEYILLHMLVLSDITVFWFMRKNCSERMYVTVNKGHLRGEGQGARSQEEETFHFRLAPYYLILSIHFFKFPFSCKHMHGLGCVCTF